MVDGKRSSAFELMRIIAMFMVVLGHCMLATAQNVEPYLGMIDNIGWCVKAFTVCAVNLFFLLTGYFSKSSTFRLSKIFDIWIKTIFYSFLIYVILSFATNSFKLSEGAEYLLPIFLKKYWYIQTYIVLALVMPFITYTLENIDLKKQTFLAVVLVVFFSIHPTFIKVAMTLDNSQGYGFIWGCSMLVIGHWLHRIQIEKRFFFRIPIAAYLTGYILASITIFISNYLIVKYEIAQGVTSRGNFYAYNSLTVFVQSICLFCVFIRLSETMQCNKSINYLAGNILSAYLISGHPLLLGLLWSKYFNMSQWWDSPIAYVILSVALSAIVIIFCVLVDKIVDRAYQKTGMKKIVWRINEWITFSELREQANQTR